MDDIISLSHEERGTFFEEAAARLGFGAAIVEKDFWVCWTLRELFRLPEWGEHLLFKGGTSLSKGWNLIRRFSEDVDIVISRERLGFPGDHSLGNKQLKRLRDACQEVVQRDITAALTSVLRSVESGAALALSRDGTDLDGQTLLMGYRSSFTSEASYLRPFVKIELGARSDTWPAQEISLHTMLAEALPGNVEDLPIAVRALLPVRTFWEKAMLLHEEYFRPADKPRKGRMARHYYDLWCLIRAGVGERAMSDEALFDSVASHRRVFFRQSWMDYDTLKRGSIRIVPEADKMADWESDYKSMESFFFPGEKPPAWEDIMSAVRDFEETVNQRKG